MLQPALGKAELEAEAAHHYEAQRHALFWVDPGSRSLYRNHVSTIINRRNAYNG